jgi:hypothetical protein
MRDLHNAIMNIPCKETVFASDLQKAAYQFGHRDARHMAAELSLEHDRELREWMEACRVAVRRASVQDSEIADLRKRAHCWDMIYAMIAALHEAGVDCTSDEATNAYIDVWKRQKARIEELEAQLVDRELEESI